jgi:hypothetical protein
MNALKKTLENPMIHKVGRRSSVDIQAQKIFAWSGPVSLLMVMVGCMMAGFLPPPSPAATAEQIATFFRAHGNMILICGVIFMLSSVPFFLFIGELSAQIRRIEGNRRTFTYAQLAMGIGSMSAILLYALAWSVAAYRPERSADVIQAFNDLGFFCIVMASPPAMGQVLMIGLATLSDKRAKPIFPRWFGYVSVFCAIAVLPGVLCVLVKTGPLAWDGMLANTIPAFSFLPWCILTAVMLVRAINQQAAEEA